MKHAVKRLLAVLGALCLLAVVPSARALDGVEVSYTYNYDFWSDVRHSPDAYRTETVINSGSLGLDTYLRAPQGLFVREPYLYICDTGNNRVLEVLREGAKYTLTRVIDRFTGDTAPLTFNAPQDVFVSEEGDFFIADMGNNRIVKLNRDLEYQLSFVKPTDPTFDQAQDFLPTKLVADSSGRVFALGRNVNKGLIKYERDGRFTGFIGASLVKQTWYEYIWKLLSTKEQRAQQASFVPTEYDNVAIDEDGFFYVVTKTFAEEELTTGLAKPVRRLNTMGTNILVENGNFWVIGDVQWAGGDTNITNSGPSKFVDIAVLENDIYVALDSTHNRLFGYDQQGNLLWAFGGVGNADGYFLRPVAIDAMGRDLLILDSQDGAITVMTPTDYGVKIFDAIDQYRRGEYELSADTWLAVLRQNGNYDLAYTGVGRARLQQQRYEEAKDCFRAARDEKNYSEAFKYYRQEWVEKNIGWIFGLLAAALVLPPIVRRARKVWQEVKEA